MEICDYYNCTGCGTCSLVCSKKCIHMIADEEGFIRPLIDEEKCVKCQRCKKTCPTNTSVKKNQEAKFFYGWNKDPIIWEKSSSGGFFSSIARLVTKKNGIVFGVYKDKETNRLLFDYVHSYEEISKFRFSKYYQAETGKVFEQVEMFINQKTLVLFTGTACQVAGLLNYLKDNKNISYLITADVLCHGTPSKMAVDMYIKDKEVEKRKHIVDYRFRVKPDDCRWSEGGSARMKLFFEDGTSEVLNPVIDTYFTAFCNNFILRESCYRCKYCGIERITDFTMADYWGVTGIDMKHMQYGVSLVLCNSEKANTILSEIDDFEYYDADKDIAISSNLALNMPNSRPKKRDNIYRKIKKYGFDNTIKTICFPKYFFFFVKRVIGYNNLQRIKRLKDS